MTQEGLYLCGKLGSHKRLNMPGDLTDPKVAGENESDYGWASLVVGCVHAGWLHLHEKLSVPVSYFEM